MMKLMRCTMLSMVLATLILVNGVVFFNTIPDLLDRKDSFWMLSVFLAIMVISFNVSIGIFIFNIVRNRFNKK